VPRGTVETNLGFDLTLTTAGMLGSILVYDVAVIGHSYDVDADCGLKHSHIFSNLTTTDKLPILSYLINPTELDPVL
jgi:hypothetical protein